MTSTIGLPVTSTAWTLATWAHRHETAGPDWAARYWASRDAPHRDVFDPIWDRLLKGPQQVLELGANAGPNLRRAAERWPMARLIAVDINTTALAFLERAARAEGWGHRLVTWPGDLRAWLPVVPPHSIDVVLSCYTLAYLAPADLPAVLTELKRITRRLGVCVEPATDGPSVWLDDVTPPGWAHDYRSLGDGARVWGSAPIDGPDRLNRVTWWEVADR